MTPEQAAELIEIVAGIRRGLPFGTGCILLAIAAVAAYLKK